MSGKKNKRLLGVISIFLWAVILTIVLRSYLEKTGYTLPVFWIVILACAAAFLGWWVYMSVRINHLIKRLDAAGFQYQTTHDEKAYLTELDDVQKMPGAEKITPFQNASKRLFNHSENQDAARGRTDSGGKHSAGNGPDRNHK